jgi:hypothetical protein
MNLPNWWTADVDYSRKLLSSGIAGAYCGEEEFLHGRRLTPFLNEAARNAMKPALVCACLAVLGSYRRAERLTATRAFAFGLLGGAIGFGAGVAWENRELVSSIASGAAKNIEKTRDEHWLEKHPIDYA